MKLLLLIPLFFTSCTITPTLSFYLSPPGVFVSHPLIPLEAGIQWRGNLARPAPQKAAPGAARTLFPASGSSGPTLGAVVGQPKAWVGLRGIFSGKKKLDTSR